MSEFTPADFSKVQVGDRLRFLVKDNGFGGSGDIVTREGVVTRITAKCVFLACSDRFGNGGRITRTDWSQREPRRKG